MKLTISIAVAVAVLAAIFMFFYSHTLFAPDTIEQGPTGINLYANGTYGLSFPYPASYLITEGERGTLSQPHYAIVLTHQDDVSVPVAGEGPRTISIDIFPREEGKTLDGWIATHGESNYSLGSKQLRDTEVNGVPAHSYTWSGLYEGETTAVLHGDSVILISVTYFSPEDAIVGDYRALLTGMTLTQ